VVIGGLLLVAYMMKPYTYDLTKYSIYFNTGFIEAHGWHSPEGGFELDPRDMTGSPFSDGFAVGFKFLAKLGYRTLPSGSLMPRFDADVGDLDERGPPRSDAMVLLVMILGFSVIYGGAKQFVWGKNIISKVEPLQIITSGPLILGSVFFMLGSQNSLRQFLGMSIIILAMAMLSSRRYVTCLILVFFSATFHMYAAILGAIGILLGILGEVDRRDYSRRQATPIISSAELLSFMMGVITVLLIKGILVFGIFNMDIPFVGDLKPYVIRDGEYESLERLSSFAKAGAIFFVFASSEIMAGRILGSDGRDIRHLRRRVFAFVIPFLVYSEIFSRVIVLYWALETVFLIWALNSKQLRVRLAGAIVFLAYGCAPNAINVLIGPNWLYSL
jgi:hypothetical protein